MPSLDEELQHFKDPMGNLRAVLISQGPYRVATSRPEMYLLGGDSATVGGHKALCWWLSDRSLEKYCRHYSHTQWQLPNADNVLSIFHMQFHFTLTEILWGRVITVPVLQMRKQAERTIFTRKSCSELLSYAAASRAHAPDPSEWHGLFLVLQTATFTALLPVADLWPWGSNSTSSFQRSHARNGHGFIRFRQFCDIYQVKVFTQKKNVLFSQRGRYSVTPCRDL